MKEQNKLKSRLGFNAWSGFVPPGEGTGVLLTILVVGLIDIFG